MGGVRALACADLSRMLPPSHANLIQALSQLQCVATQPEGKSGEQMVKQEEGEGYPQFQTPAAKVQLRACVLFSLPAGRPRGALTSTTTRCPVL